MYSRILSRTSEGSCGAASMRLMTLAERPEVLWFPLRMVQVVLRQSPSARACWSSVTNPEVMRASPSSLILEACRVFIVSTFPFNLVVPKVANVRAWQAQRPRMTTTGSGALAVMLVTSHRLLLDCYIAVTTLLQAYRAAAAHWDQGPDLVDPAASLSARLGMWRCPRAGACSAAPKICSSRPNCPGDRPNLPMGVGADLGMFGGNPCGNVAGGRRHRSRRGGYLARKKAPSTALTCGV